MNACEEAIKKSHIDYQRNGTYVVMEGPQFSTLAESNLYRSWKADVIGMTNMPEAKLAREAEIRYASVSMVTDFDCWHPDHENVDVQQVIKVLLGNAEKAKVMIKNLIDNFEDHIDPNDPTNNLINVQKKYQMGAYCIRSIEINPYDTNFKSTIINAFDPKVQEKLNLSGGYFAPENDAFTKEGADVQFSRTTYYTADVGQQHMGETEETG